MQKLRISLLVLLLILCVSSIARATNGAYFTGFGAVSQSLGGATVASGWDSISAIANPASLGLLEGNRIDISFEYFMPTRNLNDTDSDYNSDLPLSGGIAIKSSNGKFTYGLVWGNVFSLGTDFKTGALSSNLFETPGIGRVYAQYLVMKFIPIIVFTPSDKFNLGFGPGLTWQTLEISRPLDMNGNGLYDTQVTVNNSNSFGLGLNIGAIYKVTDTLRLGASYTTKQFMSDHEWNTEVGKVSYKKNGVEQAAFGIAVSPMKNLTIEVNEKWFRWSDMLGKGVLKINGNDFMTWEFGWDDQWVTSVGITYLPTSSLTLRGGWNYGKSPIKDEDVDWNLFSQTYVEHHIMIGLGYKVTKNLEVNFGYGHGFEKELTSPTTGTKIKASDDWVDFMLSHRF